MKCKVCGCESYKEVNHIYEDYYVVEYDVVCSDCGNKLGHWAYGGLFDLDEERED